jgi:hypothetical protein
MTDNFWLSLLYLVAIVLSFPPRFTTSDYPFGILWPLHCLSVLDLRLLITPLVSCSHRIVCPSSQRGNQKSLIEEGQTIQRPQGTKGVIRSRKSRRWKTIQWPQDTKGILWPLYCLSFFDFVLSVIPRLTTYDYPFGILWPLYFLSFLDLRLLIIRFGILWPLYFLSLQKS